jgi:hypothetical protein
VSLTGEPDTHTMMLVHHTGHTVESEPVKHVLVHVKPQVGQEEPKDFVVSVVEQSTVPELVSASSAFVEVAVIRAVKVVEAIEG